MIDVYGEGVAYFGGGGVPELRYLADGTPLIRFSVGFYQGKGKDQGFIGCTAWREMAEHVAESVKHGDRVTVAGRLTHRKDGEASPREFFGINVSDIGISMRFATAQSNAPVRTAKAAPPAPAPFQAPDEAPF